MLLNKFFKKDELHLLGPFYLIKFIAGLALLFPAYYVVFFRDLGFSFAQIGLLFLIYGFSGFFFELPTGVIADSFSRKLSSLIGLLIISLSGVCMALFSNYILQIFSWAFFSFGTTFLSGAFEAWVVSNLSKKRKKKALLHSFLVKNSSFHFLGAVLASLLAAFLVPIFGLTVIFVGLSLGSFIAFLIASLIPEYYIPHKHNSSSKSGLAYSFHTAKLGWSFIKSNNILLLLFLGGFFALFMHLGFDVWQPFLLHLGMPEKGLGIQYAILSSVAVVLPFTSYYFKKFPIKKVLIGVTIFKMLFLISLFFLSPPLFLFAAAMQILLFNSDEITDPLTDGLKHNILPERIRSTVFSFESMFQLGIVGLVSLLGGFIADWLGMTLALSLGAVFGIGVIWSYAKLKIPKKFQVK